jgi:hypothetical protein
MHPRPLCGQDHGNAQSAVKALPALVSASARTFPARYAADLTERSSWQACGVRSHTTRPQAARRPLSRGRLSRLWRDTPSSDPNDHRQNCNLTVT